VAIGGVWEMGATVTRFQVPGISGLGGIGRPVAAILVSINCQASVTYRPLAFKWMISGFRFPHTTDTLTQTHTHTQIQRRMRRTPGQVVKWWGVGRKWKSKYR